MRFAAVHIINLVIPLLVAGACILGGVAWWSIEKYHLPISKVLAFFATVLPTVNYVAYKYLVNRSYQNSTGQQRINISPFTALASIVLYSLDVVILTLSSVYLGKLSGQCLLVDRWEQYWREKSMHIREIQDRLSCCGLRSPLDKPFPFPGGDTKADTCRKILGTSDFCLPRWSAQMKKNAGMLVGVSALIILVNLLTLLVVLSNSRVVNRLLFFPFRGPRDYHQFMQEDDDDAQGQQQPERRRIEPYHDEVDGVQEEGLPSDNPWAENGNGQRRAIKAQEDREAAETRRQLEQSTNTPDRLP